MGILQYAIRVPNFVDTLGWYRRKIKGARDVFMLLPLLLLFLLLLSKLTYDLQRTASTATIHAELGEYLNRQIRCRNMGNQISAPKINSLR